MDITISEDEAKALIKILKNNWVPPDDQKIIFNLIIRLENLINNKT